MSSTGLESDVLLPAAAYYEKIGLKYPQSLVPYVIFGDRAVQPLGGREVGVGDLRRCSRARSRSGRGPAASSRSRTHYGIERDYATSTTSGRWTASSTRSDEEARWTTSSTKSSVTKGFTWKDAKERGALPDPGRSATTARTTRSAATSQPGDTRLPAAVVHREEAAVADADRPAAVPDRPPVVRRSGRGAAGAQGAAAGRRQLPAAAQRRPHALVDPRRSGATSAICCACSAASRSCT